MQTEPDRSEDSSAGARMQSEGANDWSDDLHSAGFLRRVPSHYYENHLSREEGGRCRRRRPSSTGCVSPIAEHHCLRAPSAAPSPPSPLQSHRCRHAPASLRSHRCPPMAPPVAVAVPPPPVAVTVAPHDGSSRRRRHAPPPPTTVSRRHRAQLPEPPPPTLPRRRGRRRRGSVEGRRKGEVGAREDLDLDLEGEEESWRYFYSGEVGG
ncbi:hypothetical protein DAI22_08g149050 [Oryza sativa Japonica Group]|nr:hypothetical protein DAI22_08g149050 [Oryza sativa Japonica Group]